MKILPADCLPNRSFLNHFDTWYFGTDENAVS